MVIGQRIRFLRTQKKLSLGDVERKVGLLRTYVSRVERGMTVPTIETLEKLAGALDVPLYQIFVNGSRPNGNTPRFRRERLWGITPQEAREFDRFRRILGRVSKFDRELLLSTAEQLARES